MKSTIQGWFSILSSFISTIFNMLIMVWRVQPIYFIGLIAILFIQGLIPLGVGWLTKILFDLLSQVILHHRSTATLAQNLFLLLVAQTGLIIVSQCINPVNLYLNAELGRRLSLKIRTSIYQKINSLVGLSSFEDPSFHDTIHLVASNAQFGPIQSITIVTSLLQGMVTVVTFLSVLITFNPLLAGIVTVVVVPQLFVQLRLGHQRFDLAVGNTPKERRASYYGHVISWIGFAKEIRLFNLGDYFLSAFVQTLEEIYEAQHIQQRHELYWKLLLALLTGIITIGAFVVVILQAFAGYISIGDVALYTSAVGGVQTALLSIVSAFSLMNECTLFYSRYANLLNLPQPLLLPSSVQTVPPLTSGIAFHNVSFRYSDRHPWILRHLDLFIPAGQCLALVGLNGVGKTTLVKLLTRLYDLTEGQILWDGININTFDPKELRQHLGAIFQDFSHYDLTVQQNIGLGNIAQIENNEVVQQAAIKANIHQRITELPQSYQSFLGRELAEEGVGVELSGGEWQKIALARMFMREADLLILDEPTAALDAQAEYDLYTQFRKLMRGRTSMLITHRFSTVRMADTIAVIENGQIKERGTHDELIALKGTYATLYTMQAENYK